ncbi:DUF4089 domain-containing protein [Hwanghaeella grinnelliae]|uniref:DUF4089 domain-containing protein n=1 Tax=Hwanghaeella grinnelliae TaxID=2500179 RepID=A0A3S2W3H2_9PROT|nr:DUF4089 domain-containing protein [Hwanghaeella grinnelliae]RVU35132.1 DUF4089 domain-containing protein [Hwanghaeella grinnelliae]
MTMSDDDFDSEAFIRTMAPSLGLSLDEERVAGVSVFLSIAKGMADILDAAPVPENSLELASVFDAGQTAQQAKAE